MGELRNCPKCGKVYVRVNRNLCPDCIQEEEEKFEEVRHYLKKNPGATIEQIAKEFEVEENVVVRWLREGRIEDARIELKLTCQMCGKPIHIGTLCSKCAEALTAQMMDKNKQEKEQAKPPENKDDDKNKRRMFVLDRYKDD